MTSTMRKRHPYLSKAPKGFITKLAKDTGKTIEYISRVMNGYRRPSFELAREIERLTNGAVKMADFGYTL